MVGPPSDGESSGDGPFCFPRRLYNGMGITGWTGLFGSGGGGCVYRGSLVSIKKEIKAP